MKIRKIALFTLALITTASIAFYSCKKEQLANDSAKKKTINYKDFADLNPSMAGFYHNEALRLTESYWSTSNDDMETLVELMDSELKENYDEFDAITSTDIDAALNNPDFIEYLSHVHDSPNDLTSYFQSRLSEMLTNQQISQAFYDEMYPVLNANLSLAQADVLIQNVSTTDFSSTEVEAFQMFSSILESSDAYWDDYLESHPTEAARLELKPNGQAALWVDAGAGLFSIFATGPMWIATGAFIAAAASSAWTE